MKGEQAKQLTENALNALAESLQAGRSDTLERFLAVAARFHRYSFRNVMLIAMQFPDATRVAGFRTWKALGRFVRKGEKGIVIVAPMALRKSSAAEQCPDDATEIMLRFKAVYVFDVTQTDGDPLPEFATVAGDPGGHVDRLKALIATKGIVLEYADDLDGAEGLSSGGRIRILSGLPAAEEFSVLAHELAHEMLHHQPGTTRLPKTVRETEAEAVAFAVCHAIGLEPSSAASDYIQLYQGDTATLAGSLERIQQVAAHIIDAVAGDTEDGAEHAGGA